MRIVQKALVLLIGFTTSGFAAWTTLPTPINPAYSAALGDVFTSVSASGESLATWQDGSFQLYYAIFNGTSWTTPPTSIDPAYVTATHNVTVFTSVSAAGEFLATWRDSSGHPYYAVFNGTSWTTLPTDADPSYMNADSSTSIFTSVNASGEFLATWLDATGAVFYAVFNGTSWTSLSQTIDPSYSNATTGQVFNSVNAAGEFVATWGDTSGAVFYALFNGTSWTTPTPIDPSYSTVNSAIFTSVNASGEFLATWLDFTGLIYYSTFNGTSWTTPTPIDPTYSGATSIVSSSANASGEFLATWQDSNASVFYAIFNGTSWTTPASIDPTYLTAAGDVFTSINASGEFLATWLDSSGKPYYAIFSSGSFSPSSLKASQHKNDFGTVKEYFVRLSWTASSLGGVQGYYVYRNGTLIATLPPSALSYENHNLNKNQRYVYSVVAFNSSGTSTPMTITVGPF